jgi:hypothetical protein
VLEQLHLPGECRLGNVQALGGTAETAFVENYQKEAERFEHGLKVIKNPDHGNSQSALSASRAAIVGCRARTSRLTEQRKLAHVVAHHARH